MPPSKRDLQEQHGQDAKAALRALYADAVAYQGGHEPIPPDDALARFDALLAQVPDAGAVDPEFKAEHDLAWKALGTGQPLSRGSLAEHITALRAEVERARREGAAPDRGEDETLEEYRERAVRPAAERFAGWLKSLDDDKAREWAMEVVSDEGVCLKCGRVDPPRPCPCPDYGNFPLLREAEKTLHWALDILDRSDARLATIDPPHLVYSRTHLLGKEKARGVLGQIVARVGCCGVGDAPAPPSAAPAARKDEPGHNPKCPLRHIPLAVASCLCGHAPPSAPPEREVDTRCDGDVSRCPVRVCVVFGCATNTRPAAPPVDDSPEALEAEMRQWQDSGASSLINTENLMASTSPTPAPLPALTTEEVETLAKRHGTHRETIRVIEGAVRQKVAAPLPEVTEGDVPFSAIGPDAGAVGIDAVPPYRFTCECGRKGTLWFNGGELDRIRCICGVLHELTYGDAPLRYRATHIAGAR